MFLFPRPFAATLAALITTGLMILINLLFQHVGG